MAQKKVNIPINWLAGTQLFTSTNDTFLTVTQPLDSNKEFSAYWATSWGFGTYIGFDKDFMDNLLTTATNNNVQIKLKFDRGLTDGATELSVHNQKGAPTPYTDINSQSLGAQSIEWKNEITIETDITRLLSQNIGFSSGLIFSPLSFGFSNFMHNSKNLIIEATGEWLPQRPNPIFPVGGIKEDRTKVIKLKWEHIGAFNQSGFDLRYRIKGNPSWSNISQTNANGYYDMPANTLDADEYEWQVRTKFGTGEVGSWTISQVFNATEETDTPFFLAPTSGQILPTQDLFVNWASEGNQTQFEIELMSSGGKVNSINKSSTNNFVTLDGWLENNKPYIVRLRILADGQFWSDWSEVNVTVSYTQPAKPILTITGDEGNSSLKIDMHNPLPSGTEPTPLNQKLFKKIDGKWVKLADLIPNSEYVDYVVASEKDYEYRVIVLADNDVTNTSSTFSGTVKVQHTMISLVNDPIEFVHLEMDPERSFSTNFSSTKMVFAGRKKAVTEFGELIEQDASMSYTIKKEELIKFNDLIHMQETLLYRDSRGRKIFATISSIEISDDMRLFDYYSISFDLSEVDYKEGID